MEPTTTATAVLNPITAGLLVGGSAYAGFKGAEYLHQRLSKSASAGLESVKVKSEMQELIEALKPKAPEPKSEMQLFMEQIMEQMQAQQAALIASLTAKHEPVAPTPAPVAPTPAPAPEGLLASLIAGLMGGGGKVQEPTPAPAAPSKEEQQLAALMELLSTTTTPKGELSEVEAKLAAAAKKK
jgi:hypothetical protein